MLTVLGWPSPSPHEGLREPQRTWNAESGISPCFLYGREPNTGAHLLPCFYPKFVLNTGEGESVSALAPTWLPFSSLPVSWSWPGSKPDQGPWRMAVPQTMSSLFRGRGQAWLRKQTGTLPERAPEPSTGQLVSVWEPLQREGPQTRGQQEANLRQDLCGRPGTRTAASVGLASWLATHMAPLCMWLSCRHCPGLLTTPRCPPAVDPLLPAGPSAPFLLTLLSPIVTGPPGGQLASTASTL